MPNFQRKALGAPLGFRGAGRDLLGRISLEAIWRASWPYIAIVVFTLLANLLLLAAPGFYSHDEWDRLEDILRSGLASTLRTNATIEAGAYFSAPMRPVGLIQQTLSALLMQSWPVLVHLFDVLQHAVVALLLFVFLRGYCAGRGVPLTAALLFAVSPLTTLATGWSAASMDRWYVLFALATLIAAQRTLGDRMTAGRALMLFLAPAGAILSKETAIVMPAAVAGLIAYLLLRRPQADLSRKRILAVLSLSSAPILIYLAIRWPALVATLTDAPPAAYSPSVASIGGNLLTYLAYPFVAESAEAHRVDVWSPAAVAALAIHALLIAGLAWVGGWRAPATYLGAYFLPLLAVLVLPATASHYLYGAAPALAAAVAALLVHAFAARRIVVAGAACLGIGLLTVHQVTNQLDVYRTAVCQSRLLVGLTTLALSDPKPSALLIVPDKSAPWWVLARFLEYRTRFGERTGLAVRMSFTARPDDAAAFRIRMRPDCVVVKDGA